MAKCAVCEKGAYFGNNVSPVSYTHLDVYKRQVVVLGSAFFVVVLVAIIASLQGEKIFYGTKIARFQQFCKFSFTN